MTSIKNFLSLVAAIPTPTSVPISNMNTNVEPRGCGEVNVFYTSVAPEISQVRSNVC